MKDSAPAPGRFAGRVVLITGGSKGIGEGCARVFCREGGNVAICARGAEAGEALAKELTAAGPGQCVFFTADVRQPEEVRQLIEATLARFGRLDCLINNAGWHPPFRPIDAESVEEFEALLRLNLTSTFAACKCALPHLVRTRGTIINMSSLAGLRGQSGATAYSATKAGQIGLTRALAADYAPQGVRINAVCPAGVDTPLMQEGAKSFADPEARIRHVAALHKLGRMATIEEIGRVCLFLATEDSSFVTGQAIVVDGGRTVNY